MVTGGRNMGRVGVITHRERHDGGFNIVHIKDAIDNSFATRENNVFIIGKDKPWISLPKGKGVKVCVFLRQANSQAHNCHSCRLPRKEIVAVLFSRPIHECKGHGDSFARSVQLPGGEELRIRGTEKYLLCYAEIIINSKHDELRVETRFNAVATLAEIQNANTTNPLSLSLLSVFLTCVSPCAQLAKHSCYCQPPVDMQEGADPNVPVRHVVPSRWVPKHFIAQSAICSVDMAKICKSNNNQVSSGNFGVWGEAADQGEGRK